MTAPDAPTAPETPLEGPESASEDLVRVYLPPALVERMIGPWYLLRWPETDQVRAAMRSALHDAQETPG